MNDKKDEQPRQTLAQWFGRRILGLSAAALTIIVATTIVGFFARHHWLADIFTNLRIQQVIGLLGVSIVLAIGRQWKWFVVALVLLCVHLPWIAPALLQTSATGDRETLGQPGLVVMTANVLTSNRRHDDILKQIESADADVFAILELGTPLYKRLESELSETYPHRTTVPQDDGNFGIGLYSRYPMTDVDCFSLNLDDIKSISATVETDSGSYRIIATHPLPPIGRSGFDSRNEHMEMLGERVSKLLAADKKIPVVMMGDLNLTPWSPWLGDFEAQSGLKLATGGNEIIPTWYVKPIFPLGLVLDHVLISDNLRCIRREIGPDVGSDHRAVIVAVAAVESK